MWDARYKQLKKDEIIKIGDEANCGERDDNGKLKWRPAARCVGGKAPDPLYSSHRWYRRLKDEYA
jgi:hypothetical protein